MSELFDHFDSVNPKIRSFRYAEGTFGKVLADSDLFQSKNKIQVALLGIPETRNAFAGPYNSGVDSIRSYFYKLAEIPRLNVVDAGNLKPGKQVKDTYASIGHVVNELKAQGIIPVVIGGSQDITPSLFQGLTSSIDEPELVIIDSKLDTDDHEYHSQSFVNQIIKNANKRNVISFVGYQSYFVSTNQLRFAYDQNWNLYRLGTVRNNFNQVEPLLRDSDLVSFDISSIRQNECPGASLNSPNGFYAEEACQLANLAGLSDKLGAFSIFEYNEAKDINGQSAHLIAQIIWHFLYGISQRKGDYPKKKLESYKKIYVKLDKMDSDLVFYENQQNKRFWVEIPIGKNNETKVIACSEFDYQQACKNELPDRIWYNISRYIK